MRDVFEQECDISADLFGLTETKLNQQNSSVSRLYHKAAKEAFGMHQIGFLGGSTIAYALTAKYGGTLTMAVDNTRGHVPNTISDSWGRWTKLELQARCDRKVLFITAYQVCATPTNEKGSTAYHQQEAMARLAHHQNIHPRVNFQRDLRTFLQQKIQQKYSIILGGDFNEALDQPRSAMCSLAMQCELSDVWSNKYPDTEFNTRHPGSKRIDYVLVTPNILKCVQSVGYFSFKH
jgi:exonuclease III